MPGSILLARRLQGAYAPPPDWLSPSLPERVRLANLSADHGRLTELERDCHPPGHVDRERALELIAEGSFRRLLDGALLGPVVPTASGEAEDDLHRVLGMCIVVQWAGVSPWPGGPWVADICVRPAQQGRGIGTAMLKHAIAACAALGAARVGLAVTRGNRAMSLYERFGFSVL